MKYFYLLLGVLLSSNLSNAQNPGNVSGYSLWLSTAPVVENTLLLKPKNPVQIQATHFNFNKMLDSKEIGKKLKNIVKDQYSLFLVFKSDTEDERPVLTINKGKSIIFLTNKELLSDTEMVYKKVDSRKGILLSFISNTIAKGKKNNGITLEDFYNGDTEGKQQLMEVLYYPRLLSVKDRQKVETYLSLKYGLSILGEFDYINSLGDKIWDYKLNTTYSNRVTGIGRDNALNLYQKQSGNAEKDGLYIGLGIVDTTNVLNKSKLNDLSFMLWGDNKGSIKLEHDKTQKDVQFMQRQWKMQLSGHFADTATTQVRISKKEMGIDHATDDFIYLAVNDDDSPVFDYASAHYYKQSREDEEYIYFNNISWDKDKSGSDTFTFVKGPEFMVNFNALASCDTVSGKIKLGITGTAPYNVNLKSDNSSKTITISDSYYEFSDLSSSVYAIEVTDSKGKSQSYTVTLDAFASAGISLKSDWILTTNGQVLITPVVSGTDTENFIFDWQKAGRTVSSDKEFMAREAGDYILIITNASGCKKELAFKVSASNAPSGWQVYPNPTKMAQPFFIQFNLEKEADVSITINSMEGKLYVNKYLGHIKDFTDKETINTAGVYMVTVTINNIPHAVKLIIN